MRVNTVMGLDGFWHATMTNADGTLRSLASGPDKDDVQERGEDVVLAEMFGDRLYPYQKTLARFYLRGEHEQRVMITSGRRLGLRQIAELRQAAARTLPPHLWPRSA
jgi:hypothetical protein